MSNKVLITNSQKAVKVPSGLRILIRRACNAVLEYAVFFLMLNLLLARVQRKRSNKIGCLMVSANADGLRWNIAENTVVRVKHLVYIESLW